MTLGAEFGDSDVAVNRLFGLAGTHPVHPDPVVEPNRLAAARINISQGILHMPSLPAVSHKKQMRGKRWASPADKAR